MSGGFLEVTESGFLEVTESGTDGGGAEKGDAEEEKSPPRQIYRLWSNREQDTHKPDTAEEERWTTTHAVQHQRVDQVNSNESY